MVWRNTFTRVTVIMAVLGIAFLALRATMVQVLPASMLTGNRLAGDSTAVFFDIARQAVLGGTVEDLLPRSRSAAVQQPLAEEPFLLAASAALRRGDTSAADRLLAQAIRREPRLRQARLMLLERYSRQGDVAAMTDQLIVLSRLMPDANELLVATVAQLVSDPGTRASTVRALQGNPLVDRVLAYLTTANADPDIVLALAQARSIEQSSGTLDWQARLIANLVAAGDYSRANAIWRQFTPEAAADRERLLYNPRFADAPGVPPFNWTLANGDIGVAERTRDGALEVTYFGRESGPLASQLLMLPAGRYTLALVSEGRKPDGAGELAWNVTCAGSDEPFTTLAINDTGETPRRIRHSLTVPSAACAAQWLRLEGTAKEFPRSRTVRIRDLSLNREEP